MRYTGDPYWMTVKYRTTCSKCGKTIERGQDGFRFKSGDIFCDGPNCGQRESASFNAAAEDEAFMTGNY